MARRSSTHEVLARPAQGGRALTSSLECWAATVAERRTPPLLPLTTLEKGGRTKRALVAVGAAADAFQQDATAHQRWTAGIGDSQGVAAQASTAIAADVGRHSRRRGDAPVPRGPALRDQNQDQSAILAPYKETAGQGQNRDQITIGGSLIGSQWLSEVSSEHSVCTLHHRRKSSAVLYLCCASFICFSCTEAFYCIVLHLARDGKLLLSRTASIVVITASHRHGSSAPHPPSRKSPGRLGGARTRVSSGRHS